MRYDRSRAGVLAGTDGQGQIPAMHRQLHQPRVETVCRAVQELEGRPSEGSATLGDRLANDRRRGSPRGLGGQAVVVLVDPLGLSPGGVPVPGAGVVPRGAKGLDVGGWVRLQALQDVLGEAR